MQKHGTIPLSSSAVHFKVTAAKIFFTIVANTVIAFFFIPVFHPGIGLILSFIYSQCIGLCIAACIFTALHYFKTSNLMLQLVVITTALLLGSLIGVSTGRTVADFLGRTIAPSIKLEKKNKKNNPPEFFYALIFGSIVSYIFISLQKISDEKIKRLELEKNAVLTEVKLLQSQMEPHFLFNTLSNILGLIESDPQKASRMLESFTSFLRSSLVTARNERITLEQELDVVRNYLNIFTVRMGERLSYRIEVPENLQQLRIPPLLIQPLVENAVKHGLEPSVQGGELLVRVERDGDIVRIAVIDSGVGVREMGRGNGIGVDNIKKRLKLLYGEKGRLVFEENRPSGVMAVIDIPYETNTSDHSR